MFSYYGSKSRIIKKYPKPKYATIIEPFAGSARYALLYPNHKVILNDKYRVIYNIWNYLRHATTEDIESLPVLKEGDDLRDFELTEVERQFMGFMVNRGVPSPCNIYTRWASGNGGTRTPEIEIVKSRAISYLDKIRHWKVFCRHYRNLPNIEGSWYIDPPYANGGSLYIENKIDYDDLADWCRTRRGQVIVCENGSADWLPFEPLTANQGQSKTTMELVWTN